MNDVRGVVRLLNTSDGGVLCLAGVVSAEVVADFHGRHGREPVPVAAIDAGSVTAFSAEGLDLVLDHLDAASLRGRDLPVRRSQVVARSLRQD
jgi:hypothetical protein